MVGSAYFLNTDGKPQGCHITYRGNIVVENSLENSIHEGRRFFTKDWVEIDAEGSFNMLLVTGQSSNSDYSLHLDLEVESDVENNLEAFLMPTVTDNGTEIEVHNHNGNYLTALFNSQIYKNATISDNGTSVLRTKLLSGKKLSATRYSTGELVIAGNRILLLKIDNVDTAGFICWQAGLSQIYTGEFI